MAGPALIPISIEEVSENDLRWLIVGCKTGYAGIGPEHILKNVANGAMSLLRFRDQGIFVVQTWIHESGVREFIIWAMAGKGILNERDQIFSELKELARINKCKFIGGRATRRGLARIYEKLLETKPQAVYFAKEL